MPSNSLQNWNEVRIKQLDEIEHAHQSVGGDSRGRRFATQQINHAYTMLLSSQFQGFCRDLHSEAVDHLARHIEPVTLRSVLRAEFTHNRKLDSGNPNPGNLGSDFNRLGVQFWPRIRAMHHLNNRRFEHLEELMAWRNAIAHQNFDPARLGGTISLRLATIRQWRKTCQQFTGMFDQVIRHHLEELLGTKPW